jgi:tetratricopeptide (TPR) repeat protein
LAYNYYRLRRRDDAFAVAAQAWQAAQQVSTTPQIDVYPALYLLARQQARLGNVEAGEALLRQALRAHDSRYGPRHRRTNRAKDGLAGFLYDHHRKLDEAEKLYQEALHAQLGALGENHDGTQALRRNLALLYESTGRPEQALQELLKILIARPAFKEAVQDVARLLPLAGPPSLAALTDSGELTWRFRERQPETGWRQPSFDDAQWQTDRLRGRKELWLRGRVELAALPDARLAVKIQGAGTFDLFVNGVPGVRQFGATGDGFHFAVLTEEAHRALTVGTNLVALHARDLSGDAPFAIEFLAFAPASAR